jgi:hypothetical protein
MDEKTRVELLQQLIKSLAPVPTEPKEVKQTVKAKRKYQYKDKAKAEARNEINRTALKLSRTDRALGRAVSVLEADEEVSSTNLDKFGEEGRIKLKKYSESIETKKALLRKHFTLAEHAVVTPDSDRKLNAPIPTAATESGNAPEPTTNEVVASEPEKVLLASTQEHFAKPETVAVEPDMDMDAPITLRTQEPSSSQVARPVFINKTLERLRDLDPMDDSEDQAVQPVVHRISTVPPTAYRSDAAGHYDSRRSKRTAYEQDEEDTPPPSQENKQSSQERFLRPGNMDGRLPTFERNGDKLCNGRGIRPMDTGGQVADRMRRMFFPDNF